MSGTGSTDRLVLVDRLMGSPWFSGVAKRIDMVSCTALDAADASWQVMKDPLSEVLETMVYSTLGQFTIGCLETGVDITANILDKLLPVEEKSKSKTQNMPKENVNKEPRGDTPATSGTAEVKEKTILKERKGNRIKMELATVVQKVLLPLRNLQRWLNSLKLDPYNDLCGQCAKRRKVIATRRMGAMHALMHLSAGAVTAPLNLVGVSVNWDVLRCAITLSGNEKLDKSPVRPKSASEKRKHPELSSSDEDNTHTFNEDLEDYESDEDFDYRPPEKNEDSTDSEEYAQGDTESDVSLGVLSSSPVKERAAKKSAKSSIAKTDMNSRQQSNEKNKAETESKKATEKTTGQLNGSDINSNKDKSASGIINGHGVGKDGNGKSISGENKDLAVEKVALKESVPHYAY